METLHSNSVLNKTSSLKKLLLVCGIISPAIYIITDILASMIWKGYSYTDQYVSELFAIGAPTGYLVVPLFTLASVLMLALGCGVWISSGQKRSLRFMAIMIACNAVDSIILWNFFPMHMRGETPTLTDAMHLIFAANPFILISIITGAVVFKNWFRSYSIITIIIMLVLAVLSFMFAPNVYASQPTPMAGLMERISQYSHSIWHMVLTIMLLRKSKGNQSL